MGYSINNVINSQAGEICMTSGLWVFSEIRNCRLGNYIHIFYNIIRNIPEILCL
ncbi:MAG: hypothetical protein RLZZ501_2184 [Pseudomonadota bacterium]|jgi:hypothetical protein